MDTSTKIAIPQANELPPIAPATAQAVQQPTAVSVSSSGTVSLPVAAGASAVGSGFNLVTSVLSSQLSTWKDERLKTFRPISEFTDKTRFALPPPTQLFTRIKTNLFYFQSNYVAVFVFLALYCALTSTSFLFWGLVFAGLWYYLFKYRQAPLRVGAYEIPQRQATIGFFILMSLFVTFAADIGPTLWWLFMATTVVVLVHALLYIPPEIDEFGFGTLPETMPPPASLPMPPASSAAPGVATTL
eukprot:TRINITY_DN1502_c0_g1_i2.p2 TRINITY_DN1502_c0_g1~~TRINITY_DN1502_c0_g1_i2.p2  ORF type:complete len:280 (+),score=40.01 TRINITY_DN1502_c0_g1_i2:110-841(+)